MIRTGDRVFIDSGAWIALALTKDPLHDRAREAWDEIVHAGSKTYTSVPIVLETFTFLERNAARDVALAWKGSLDTVKGLRVVTCSANDMKQAWKYFKRADLHKLSAVDATSFGLMSNLGIRRAFAFDHHFAAAGFRLVG